MEAGNWIKHFTARNNTRYGGNDAVLMQLGETIWKMVEEEKYTCNTLCGMAENKAIDSLLYNGFTVLVE